MQQTVRDDDGARRHELLVSRGGRGAPAGFAHEESPGPNVPRLDAKLPIPVQPPQRRPRTIQRGGTQTSHALRAQLESGKLGQVVPGIRADSREETITSSERWSNSVTRSITPFCRTWRTWPNPSLTMAPARRAMASAIGKTPHPGGLWLGVGATIMAGGQDVQGTFCGL